MINQIKAKIKVNKWYYHIPVIGPIMYAIVFEFYINKIALDDAHPENKIYKKVKKWRTLANVIGLLIAISFIVPFFVLRNTANFGAYPWFFWVGLAIGLMQSVTPYWSFFLYKKGLDHLMNKTLKKIDC